MDNDNNEPSLAEIQFERNAKIAAFASMFCHGDLFPTVKQYLDALQCESMADEIAAGIDSPTGHQIDPELKAAFMAELDSVRPRYGIQDLHWAMEAAADLLEEQDNEDE